MIVCGFGGLSGTGRAVSVLGIPAFRTLLPIPQNEIDVAPSVTQNSGTEKRYRPSAIGCDQGAIKGSELLKRQVSTTLTP